MAQVLVRNIDDVTLSCLKQRAKQQGRSLQGELKIILENAAESTRKYTLAEILNRTESIRIKMQSQNQTDSVALLREDRD